MKKLLLVGFISLQAQAALPPEYRLEIDSNTKATFINKHALIKNNLLNENAVSYYFPTPYGDKKCQVEFIRDYPKPKQTKNTHNDIVATQPLPVGPAPNLVFKASNCPIHFTALNNHLAQCRHTQAKPRNILGSTMYDHTFHALPICQRPELNQKTLEKRLTKLLHKTLTSELLSDELENTSLKTAFYDLNDDGLKDAIVHLQNRYFCGTGGCPTYVYQLDIINGKPKYLFTSRIGLTKTPIYILNTITSGWHDIAVHVSGGGTTPRNVALKFNHHTINYTKTNHKNKSNKTYIGYPSHATKSNDYVKVIRGKPKGALIIR